VVEWSKRRPAVQGGGLRWQDGAVQGSNPVVGRIRPWELCGGSSLNPCATGAEGASCTVGGLSPASPECAGVQCTSRMHTQGDPHYTGRPFASVPLSTCSVWIVPPSETPASVARQCQHCHVWCLYHHIHAYRCSIVRKAATSRSGTSKQLPWHFSLRNGRPGLMREPLPCTLCLAT
jgi:hypothetical protein